MIIIRSKMRFKSSIVDGSPTMSVITLILLYLSSIASSAIASNSPNEFPLVVSNDTNLSSPIPISSLAWAT